MSTASLTVRISADINDFAKQLNKMTKDVEHAAEKVQHLGAMMTLGITVPVLAATAALAKFAMENDRVGAQFERVFGEGVKKARLELEELAKIVPETTTGLEQMAIRTNNLVQALGIAPEQAAKLSTELIKMSAGFAAFAGMDQAEALEGMVKGMEGAMRSLKKMGLSKSDVEIEAFRLGLMGVGQELTATGQALAVYSLMAKKATLWTGEAGKVAQSSEGQFHMMTRDVLQLADDLSMALIPTMRRIIGMLREFLAMLKETPPWLLKMVAGIAALAAVIGPTIWLVASLVKTFHLLRSVYILLAGAEGMAKLAVLLAAPEVVGALLLIGTAIATLTYLWFKFNKTAEKTPDVGTMAPPIDVKTLLGLGGKNDPTARMTGNPYEQLMKAGSLAQSAYDQAVKSGDDLGMSLNGVVDIQKQAYDMWSRSNDKMGEMAQGALKLYFTMRDIKMLESVVNGAMTPERASRATLSDATIARNIASGRVSEQDAIRGRQAQLSMPIDAITLAKTALLEFGEAAKKTAEDLITRGIKVAQPTDFNAIRADAAMTAKEDIKNMQASLLFRASMLQLPSAFDAVRQAMVELGEATRKTHEGLILAWTKLKQQVASPKALGGALMAGLEEGLTAAVTAIGPMAIAFTAIQKVLEPILALLDMLMEPLAALGQIIAIILIPIMKPLFEALKLLGIGASVVGEIFYRIAGAIQQAVGGLIKGLGKLVSKIPGLGGLGKNIQKLGDWFLNMADESKKAANDLKKARDQLMSLQFGETYDALGNLTDAANSAAESLLNVPTGFRIALDRFLATAPVNDLPNGGSSTIPGSNGAGSGDSGGGGRRAKPRPDGTTGGDGVDVNAQVSFAQASADTPIVLVMDGVVVAKTVVKNLQRQSQARFGTTLRWSEVMP